jgi:ABC-type proline/glycine betaine transport system permease subunit
MKLALKLVPKGLQERAQPMVRRIEGFLRAFEWTWTKAVVASLVFWIIGITFIALIPSWWLYFAEQKLGWRDTPQTFLLFELRDLIAIILFSLPFGAFIVIPYYVQKWRRRLRSESEGRPTGGYR